MELIGNIKTYDWGKLGLQSEVAKLAKLNGFDPNPDTPYSELWMGDHISGPSLIKGTGETLDEFISKDKTGLIGGHDKLPFLFKVLSIRKALSIQVHPNKSEAERLHAKYPDVYKDSNHKPELAIALTPFTALCGFRPYEEILELCQKFKPLEDLIGTESIQKLTVADGSGLQDCFEILMKSDEANIEICIDSILKNYETDLSAKNLDTIFKTLNTDFPNDVGTLCIFFLNVIRLNPGDAIFLSANEPHAYLDGDCIECMACSDNVVRAGLTPKFKDIDTLLHMLNYAGETPDKKFFQPVKVNSNMELFSPDIDDFAVGKITIPTTETSYNLKNTNSGSILLVLAGECLLTTTSYKNLSISRGSIIFLPGNCGEIDLNFTTGRASEFVAFQAMYNIL